MRLTRALAAALLCGIVLLTACSSLTGGGSGSSKQLTILQSADPKSLDPSVSGLGHESNIFHQVLNPLVWTTNDLKPDPELALSWTNVDPVTWEVKLRTGVKFTN